MQHKNLGLLDEAKDYRTKVEIDKSVILLKFFNRILFNFLTDKTRSHKISNIWLKHLKTCLGNLTQSWFKVCMCVQEVL